MYSTSYLYNVLFRFLTEIVNIRYFLNEILQRRFPPSLYHGRQRISYSRYSLHRLNNPQLTPHITICSKLKDFGIHSCCYSSICARHRSKKRPHRGGTRAKNVRPINAIMQFWSPYCRSLPARGRGVNLKNLIPVSIQPTSTSFKPLKVACFNAHSVGLATRRTEIRHFVVSNNIDIMFIVESWLKENGDATKLYDLTPTGYSIKSFPRLTRGGGIAILAKNDVFSRLDFLSNFEFQHLSFELAQAKLSLPQRSITFLLISPSS